MINAYHFVDAMPATLAGMVALWVGGSARHWFVRSSVVFAGLLALLMIPAYEMVIVFGAEILVVVVGLKTWRCQRTRWETPDNGHSNSPRWSQVSLQTLMLLTVVVAVAVAVAAKFPALSWFQWNSRAGCGAIAGGIVLLCAWLVLGKASRTIRVVAAFVLWGAMAIGISLLEITGYAIYYRLYNSTRIAAYVLQPESREWVWTRSLYWLATLAIAAPVLCTWLYLTVQAGWYAPFADSAKRPASTSPRSRGAAWFRGAVVALWLVVASLPLYLFWQLMTPLPDPRERSLMPSGYTELTMAAEMIDDSSATRLRQHLKMSIDALADELAANNLAMSQMRKAFSHPAEYVKRTVNDEQQDAGNLIWVVVAQLDLANRKDVLQMKVEASTDLLRLMEFLARDSGPAAAPIYLSCQDDAVRTLWRCRQQLSSGQMQKLVNTLWELDHRRIPWGEVEEHLMILSNAKSGWEWHLQSLLDDWTGYDRFAEQRLDYLNYLSDDYLGDIAKMRVLICDLAIQVFRHDNNRLPNQLSELVPDYLPAIPADPFGEAHLVYRAAEESVTLYSLGRDGDDDHGETFDPATGDGDLVADDLFPLTSSGNTAGATASSEGKGNTSSCDDSQDELNGTGVSSTVNDTPSL